PPRGAPVRTADRPDCTKPISPAVVRARITTHLALSDQTRHLERLVDERTRQVAAVRDATIVAMASLAETRDNETGNHIRRTQNYVRELARAMAADPRWAEALTDEVIDLLYKSAPLHDIGKVGIPDHILLKPGRLTADEFEIMKTHAVLGRDAIATTEEMLGGDEDSFLRFAREIAYTHQEKWDGSGYPQGLKGEEIPLSGRLMAVADVYDALISKRVYKPAFSHEEAVRLISEGRGGHFDPEMVDVFLTIADRFRQIATEFADHH
ncbi:MAG: HD domain-containing protein, partial [Alphaproteobacteria bacterium]|nr:HD domain-containing protein [Alphaproteobacteria bacterium]